MKTAIKQQRREAALNQIRQRIVNAQMSTGAQTAARLINSLMKPYSSPSDYANIRAYLLKWDRKDYRHYCTAIRANKGRFATQKGPTFGIDQVCSLRDGLLRKKY